MKTTNHPEEIKIHCSAKQGREFRAACKKRGLRYSDAFIKIMIPALMASPVQVLPTTKTVRGASRKVRRTK